MPSIFLSSILMSCIFILREFDGPSFSRRLLHFQSTYRLLCGLAVVYQLIPLPE